MTGRPLRVARTVARSSLGAAAAVLLAAVLLQTLVAFAPGDAADVVAGGETVVGGPELGEGLRRAWGLDASAGERAIRTLLALTGGDLGTSWTVRPGAPVAELLLASAPPTLGRACAALGLAFALSGALAVARPATASRSGAPRAARLLSALSALPVFLAALLLVHGLNAGAWAAVQRGWIARPGWFALPDQPSGLRTALSIAVLALCGGAFAELHAGLRAAAARVRSSAFFEAADVRGEAPLPRLLLHLAAPAASALASSVPWMLGASVVVERVFLLNGAGALLWTACGRRDVPVAVGVAVACAAVVGLARVCADGLRSAVDPREEQG